MNELKPRSAEQATCSANAELTEADVMRALELCNTPRSGVCKICPYHEFGASCHTKRNADALALLREKDALLAEWDAKCNDYETALMGKDAEIERLRKAKYIYSTVDYCADDLAKAREKIERLKADNKDLVDLCHLLNHSIEEERAIVIDEFAERLKEGMQDLARIDFGGVTVFAVGEAFIDRIAKKMKGEGATHGE